MTKPRHVEPGTTYLITRRCVQRQFLLVPSARLNQIVAYCLAIATARTGVRLHAACVLSNHYHLVVTDVRGELPEFMRWLNEFLAKCINASYGRWESVWAPGSYSAVKLVQRNDVLAKIVYTLNNPVDGGLVREGRLWPGLRSTPFDMLRGTRWTAERPKVYFSDNTDMPDVAEFSFSPPPDLGDRERFVDDVNGVLQIAEERAREKMVREGRRFVGRKAILAQRHTQRPKTREPRRKLSPRIACRDRWRRIETLGRLRLFSEAYRAAWLRLNQGFRDVLFPPGTYALVRYAGVRCGPPG